MVALGLDVDGFVRGDRLRAELVRRRKGAPLVEQRFDGGLGVLRRHEPVSNHIGSYSDNL